MRMRTTGIDKFSPRHRQSSTVQLDCHLSKCMSIDSDATSDQAIGANNAGFDSLAGLHDREQRDHAAQRKIDALDSVSRLSPSSISLVIGVPGVAPRTPAGVNIFTTELVEKRLSLLRDLVPTATT